MEASRSSVWVDGLFTGVLGYVAVVIFVGLVDLALGRSLFYTPAAFGDGLISTDADRFVSAAPVLAYNGLHLLVFLVVGVLVSWLAYEVELHPAVWYVAFFACVSIFFLSVFFITAFGDPLGEVLPWWAIFGANIVAAGVMGTYLVKRHPQLWRKIESSGAAL
jgi:hypothetical protein